jgi:hypothetical protein
VAGRNNLTTATDYTVANTSSTSLNIPANTSAIFADGDVELSWYNGSFTNSASANITARLRRDGVIRASAVTVASTATSGSTNGQSARGGFPFSVYYTPIEADQGTADWDIQIRADNGTGTSFTMTIPANINSNITVLFR